jgi:hypothetical protein
MALIIDEREKEKSNVQIGYDCFTHQPIHELKSFLNSSSLEDFFNRKQVSNKNNFWQDIEGEGAKRALTQWLHMIQDARSRTFHGRYSRAFLKYKFGEVWEEESQSIINTLCTTAPDHWLEEIEDIFSIEICKEDDIDYSTGNRLPLLVFQEANEKDIQITMDFINYLTEND